MLATVLQGPGDIRVEEVAEPKILKSTEAIIKLLATCLCGSDLWPYRGLQPQASQCPAHLKLPEGWGQVVIRHLCGGS